LPALRSLLEGSFASVEIRLAALAASETSAFPPLKRALARVYGRLSHVGPLRPLLLRITPYFDAACRK
jgi:hypothetical protein